MKVSDNMLKKNGFTIVELIAVIIILSMIMVFGIQAISSSRDSTNKKIYETKISNIEDAAVLYGQDTFKSETITVDYLAKKHYIQYDETKNNKDIVTDPSGKYSSLNDCEITITVNTSTRKVTAKFNENKCE